MTSDAGHLQFGTPAATEPSAGIQSAASAMAHERVERLLTLIAQQQRLIEQVETLSVHQSQLVASDDGERLLSLLGERQALIEGLEALGGQAGPVRRELEPDMGLIDPRRRDDLIKREAVLAQTVARVSKRDAEDAKLLAARRDQLADELAGLGRTRRAVHAYGSDVGDVPPTFQDRRG